MILEFLKEYLPIVLFLIISLGLSVGFIEIYYLFTFIVIIEGFLVTY